MTEHSSSGSQTIVTLSSTWWSAMSATERRRRRGLLGIRSSAQEVLVQLAVFHDHDEVPPRVLDQLDVGDRVAVHQQ